MSKKFFFPESKKIFPRNPSQRVSNHKTTETQVKLNPKVRHPSTRRNLSYSSKLSYTAILRINQCRENTKIPSPDTTNPKKSKHVRFFESESSDPGNHITSS
jgi:hypothetical protein